MTKYDIATLLRTGNLVEIPKVTYSEFIVAAAEFFRETNQRLGQAYFNTLVVLRPDISEAIRGTDLDAFHDNNKLPAMLAYAYKKW